MGVPNATPALVLESIERRWGPVPVLKGATLRLVPGTISWLGGANGAGKTTLLRIASGMLLPHAGTVSLAGLEPDRDRREYQRRLGYLAAGDRGLYARLSVTRNLEFWAGLALVRPSRRRELIATAIGRFGLVELAQRRVDRLSMGQRQRVRLAMTFLHEPQVALLDEPHTSLDDDSLGLLEVALADLVARGGAALWCSPAHQQLPLHADVRHLLRDGIVTPA